MKQDSRNNGIEAPSPNNGKPEVIRKRKKHRSHKKAFTAAKVVGAIVVIAAVIGVAAFAFFSCGASSVKAPVDSTSGIKARQTIEYKGEQYTFNENMVTVLLIGHDDSADKTQGRQSSEADSIMALAIDTSTGKTTAINIPRDTMCLVDKYSNGEFAGTVTEQICLAYGYGSTPEQASENVVKSACSVLCNVPIKYYYTIDEYAVADLNDAIGGVVLTPLETIPGTDIVEGEETVLLGKTAHDYVQYRDTSSPDSSSARQARGVQYVKAFVSQAFGNSTGAAKRVLDLVGVIADHSVTNISSNEMTYLSSVVADSLANGLDVVSLAGTATQDGRYVEFHVDEDALYKTVLDTYYLKES